MVERKRFDMPADLSIEIGPDRFHTARLKPLPVGQILELLMFKRPEDAYREGINNNDLSWMADVLSDACYDWNSTWSEEEGGNHSVDNFYWMGLSFKAKGADIDVWAQFLIGEKGLCTTYLDREAINGKAFECGMKALVILDQLRRPEDSR